MSYKWNGFIYSKSSSLQAELGDYLIERLQVKSGETILDAGCGVGNLTHRLLSLANPGTVLGIDSSSSMIEEANLSLQEQGINHLEFRVCSILDMNFEDQFDVIYSNSVLHWVKESWTALKLFKKALKSNGRIGLQFPLLNENHPLILFSKEAIRKNKLENFYCDWVFPWFVPDSQKAYTELLSKTGFKNIQVEVVETQFNFKTVTKAYHFFDAVGLNLYLSPLSNENKDKFKRDFLQALEKRYQENSLELDFQRIFVFASI
jgi:trans-aconitate methyltransferase